MAAEQKLGGHLLRGFDMLKKIIILTMLALSINVFGTVSSQYAPEQFSCNGSTTTFNFTFRIYSTSDLVVYLLTISTGAQTLLTQDSDYTVSAENDDYSSGGTITTISTYSSAYKILACRSTALTQEASFPNNQALENTLDRQTLGAQENKYWVEKTIRTYESDSHIDMNIPTVANRASKYFTFDSTGKPSVTAYLVGSTLGSLDIAGSLTVDNSTLYVDATNNRVGIGTTALDYHTLTIGGGGIKILDGGIPGSTWLPINSTIIDHASGDQRDTRFWSIGSSGTPGVAGSRGQFAFYGIDGSNNPAFPNEIGYMFLRQSADISCVGVGHYGTNPVCTLDVRPYSDANWTGGISLASAASGPTGNIRWTINTDCNNVLIFRNATTGRDFLIDSKANVAIGYNGTTKTFDANAVGVLVLTTRTPPSNTLNDRVQLWCADVNDEAERASLHLMSEGEALPKSVVGSIIKKTTGHISNPCSGTIEINHADNTVCIYAEGAWRTLASW